MTSLLVVAATDEMAHMPNLITQDLPSLRLCASLGINIPAGSLVPIQTGIRLQLPTGYWAEIRTVQRMIFSFLDVKHEVIQTVCFYFFFIHFFFCFY